jgi:hypothetical protein
VEAVDASENPTGRLDDYRPRRRSTEKDSAPRPHIASDTSMKVEITVAPALVACRRGKRGFASMSEPKEPLTLSSTNYNFRQTSVLPSSGRRPCTLRTRPG